MKISVSKGKYVLDPEQLKSLFLYIYDKGVQNGILIESGVGVDRTEEELALFMLSQSDTKTKRTKKETLPSADFSRPIKERMMNFAHKLAEFKGQYTREQLKQFYDYWSEYNEGGSKMLFEKRETFNIELRLKRFKFTGQFSQTAQKKTTTIDKYKEAYERNKQRRQESGSAEPRSDENGHAGENGVVDEIATEV